MKHKQFKITGSTLFVYKAKGNSRNPMPTQTDPTTSLTVATYTGVIVGFPGK